MRCFYMVYKDGRVRDIVPYDASRHHGYKFLYFVDTRGNETLLVSSDLSEHRDMFEDFNRRQDEGCQLNKNDLRGAGNIEWRRIVNWASAGFRLCTPEELKPRILKLLGLSK